MTKEEFASIVSREIERLQKEEKELNNRVQFLKKIDSPKNEIEEAEYQLSLVIAKLHRIQSFVGIEARARIQAMSDIELEQYRAEQQQLLELKRERVNVEMGSLANERIEYEKELKDLTSKGDFSDEAVRKGQDLRKKISDLEVKAHNLQAELSDLEQQITAIKSKTPQQVKEELLSKAENQTDIDAILEVQEPYIPESQMASDFDKAKEVAGLRRRYQYLASEERSINIEHFYSLLHLPDNLSSVIRGKYKGEKGFDTYRKLTDPTALIEVLERFRKSFDGQRRIFETLYTMDNLSPLIGKDNINNITDAVDFRYLERHAEVVGKEALEELRSLVERHNALSKKLFKTGSVKSEIESLSYDIRNKQLEIYRKIIRWYNGQFNFEYFTVDYRRCELDLRSMERLMSSLNNVTKILDAIDEAITELEKQAKDHQKQIEDKKVELKKEQEEIKDKITALTGVKETYVSTAQDQLRNVVDEASRGYQAEVIQQVKEEAQAQADQTEADLRQVTLQQLYEMRRQLSEQKQEEPDVLSEETGPMGK